MLSPGSPKSLSVLFHLEDQRGPSAPPCPRTGASPAARARPRGLEQGHGDEPGARTGLGAWGACGPGTLLKRVRGNWPAPSLRSIIALLFLLNEQDGSA